MQVTPILRTDEISVFGKMVKTPEDLYNALISKRKKYIGYTEITTGIYAENQNVYDKNRTKCIFLDTKKGMSGFSVESYFVGDEPGDNALVRNFWPKHCPHSLQIAPRLIIIFSNGMIYNIQPHIHYKIYKVMYEIPKHEIIKMPKRIEKIYVRELVAIFSPELIAPVGIDTSNIIEGCFVTRDVSYCGHPISSFNEINCRAPRMAVFVTSGEVCLDVKNYGVSNVFKKYTHGMETSGDFTIVTRILLFKHRNTGLENDVLMFKPDEMLKIGSGEIGDNKKFVVTMETKCIIIFAGPKSMEILYFVNISKTQNSADSEITDLEKLNDVGYRDIKKIDIDPQIRKTIECRLRIS